MKLHFYALLIIFLFSLVFFTACDNDSTNLESKGPSHRSDDDDDNDASDDDTIPDDDDPEKPTDSLNPLPTQISVTVHEPPESNTMARKITVTCSRPLALSGQVTHPDEPGYCPSDPLVSSEATEHEFWFYGLFPESTFGYEFFAPDKKEEALASGNFDTPAIPDWYHYFPIDVANDPNTVDQSAWPVLTFNIVSILQFQNVGVIIAFDRDGRIRYFHPTKDNPDNVYSPRYSGLRILENGDISWNDRNKITAVTPKGEEYTLFELQMDDSVLFPVHHNPYIYSGEPKQALVLFNHMGMAEDCNENPVDSAILDGFALIDENGIPQYQWYVEDYWEELSPDPPNECTCGSSYWGFNTYDFSHANSVYPIEGEDAALISLRNLNRVVKVDTTDGSIIWQMGRDADTDFTWVGPEPEDEKWFLMQHDAQLLSPTRMIVFDNESTRVDCVVRSPWSRAMELEIDQSAMTVQLVWEYRMPFARAMGNVERLANGNTFISGGTGHMLAEVDSAGQELWYINFPLALLTDFSSGHMLEAWWKYE